MTWWQGAGLPAVLAAVALGVLRGPPASARVRRAAPRGGGGREATQPPAGDDLPRAVSVLRARIRPARGDGAKVRCVAETWARQLRAGVAVDIGLVAAIEDVDGANTVLRRTRASVAVGGDIGAAIRSDAGALRADVARRALLALAACWAVADRQGGRLADALDRVADGIRADEQHVAHVRAELAGARASARLLAVLPLFALVLASGLGMNPVAVLVDDPFGRVALVAGVVLDVLGLVWTARIGRSAEQSL